MRHSRVFDLSMKCAVLFVVPFLLVSSCKTMEPVLDVGAAVGVATGTVSHSQAQSIKRSAVAVGKTFQDITPEQEYYIGRAVAATVLGKYRPYDDPAALQYVNTLGQTLAQASDRPETFGGYHFLILDSAEINAFAAPGGLILITRGMIELCGSEDQLAAVLAHEIGHIQGKHGLKAIKTSRLTSALTILAVEGAKNFGGGEVAQVMEAFDGSITDVVSTLTNNGYSRDLERDADRATVTILTRVGYNPAALTEMLAEMGKKIKTGGPGFAKTHPDPGDRIKEVGAGMPAVKPAAAPPARQERFAKAVGNV